MVGGDKAAEAMTLRGQSEAGDQGATVAFPCHHTRPPPRQPITVIRGSFPVAERLNAQFPGC